MSSEPTPQHNTQSLFEKLRWRDTYFAGATYEPNHVVRGANNLIWRARLFIGKSTPPPATLTFTDPNWDPLVIGTMSGADIVAAIDSELGGTTWQGGGSGSGVVNLSIANRDLDSLEVASDTGGTPAEIPSATTLLAGLESAADKSKLDGIEAGAQVNVDTDLSIGTHDSTSLQILSSTGADVTLPVVTPTSGTNLAGLMSAADKEKLDGIAAGAEVNVDTDLSIANQTSTTLDILSSTGNDVTVPAATPVSGTNLAGLMTAADKTKLDNLFTASATPPSSPRVGDAWLDTDLGVLFIWFDDGDSTQWVEWGVGMGDPALSDGQVTYAKIQDVTDMRVLGRAAGSAGVVQELILDSDTTLAADSDAIIPTQKAVKAYAVPRAATANLTAGYTATEHDNGNSSGFTSSILTPDPTLGNMQKLTNDATFTMVKPTAAGSYTMVLDMTNAAGAGAINTTDYTKVTGDSLTTTNGHKFRFYISKGAVGAHLSIQAMQ